MQVTREQVREMDRRAIEDFGIPGVILMENAGRAVAEETWKLAEQNPHARVAILCGKGNNGGDGYVVARHLFNRGMDPAVIMFARPADVSGDAAVNLAIIRKMGLAVEEVTSDDDLCKIEAAVSAADVLVDALLGTGLAGDVRGPIRRAIEIINGSGKAVVAVDIPSGLDANTGQVLGACVATDVTVTFVAPKIGFERADAPAHVGTIVTAEISIPRQVLEEKDG
ncbi:MAG: NAD(P)H-hydrate epimerase [Planctomycetes bacterium]|nr:NAD(P)H-hydrate epimerase [Planctomycetota bacterium]